MSDHPLVTLCSGWRERPDGGPSGHVQDGSNGHAADAEERRTYFVRAVRNENPYSRLQRGEKRYFES